jgi:CNT family concentrative nucleoside transporter
MEIIRGFLGLIMLVGIAYLFSKHKKNINWKLVITGILIQFVLAVLVFKQIQIPFTDISMSSIFAFLASFFTQLLSFTDAGAQFIFGNWPDSAEIFKLGAEGRVNHTIGYVFAFKVLPTVVFFSALTSLLYYLGILQKIVYGFAWVLSKTMRLSGAESLAAAANIFVGQTEAPLIVKPYISKMTNSEIMCLMTGGMATIAGGVFAAFIGFLGGDDIAAQQEFAKHLLTASILSAPAAIVCAKILFPETEKVNQNLDINKEKIGSGPLEAISTGTTDGIRLAVNVAGMILVFLAFIALINYLLINVIGGFDGIGSWRFTSLNEIIQSNTIY